MLDPAECLDIIRSLTRRVGHHPDLEEEVVLLATKLAALDSWLARGGELPDQWKR